MDRKYAILLIAVLAVTLHFCLIQRQGLWVDEISSLARATGHSLEHPASGANPAEGDYQETSSAHEPEYWRRYLQHDSPPSSVSRLIRGIFLSDTNPPLYYILLHCWTRICGTGDVSLRLFSVLCSLICIPLMWSLGRQTAGFHGGVLAALFFALAPIGIYYSIEGRMYSLLWLELLAATWCTIRLQTQGWKPLTALCCILAGSAALLTHYYAVFVWPVLLLWGTARPGVASRRSFLWIGLITLALVLPWYALVPESFARWRVTGEWLRQPSSLKTILIAPFQLCRRMISPMVLGPHQLLLDLLIGIAVIGTLVTAVKHKLFLKTWSSELWIWLWILFACAGPSIQDLLLQTSASTERRYGLQGFPAVQLFLAMGMTRMKPYLRRVLLVALLTGYSSGIWALFYAPVREQRNFRELGAQLTSWFQPGDVLIVHSIPQGVLATARYVNAPLPIAAWTGQLSRRKVPDDIERFAAGKKRIALLKIHDLDEDAPEEIWLRQHRKLLGHQKGKGFELLVFGR